MAANRVNGSGNGARSGAQTLDLLAAPLNVAILRTLADGPRKQSELRSETGSPAQTTLRAQLSRLTDLGVTERHRRNRFPGVLEHELTAPGRDLLFVMSVLERWLGEAPGRPLILGEAAAKSAVRALADGWSMRLLRALAAGPLSLTELDRLIGALSYPALERRLAAMRLAGQVARCHSNERGTPYEVTAWLRRGMGPLIAAMRWERSHDRAAPAIAGIDAEAILLLAMPLLALPGDLSGSCRLAIEVVANRRQLAGVTVTVLDGAIEHCTTRLDGDAEAWALGSPAAWLSAVIDRDPGRLEIGGHQELARALLAGLNAGLFAKTPANSKRHLTPGARSENID